ncbi:3-hydroxyisobutyrate dehydrogenase, NAD-binding domain,NAD(P)-binding domain,6-phosphogluconate [Cinara cedri]|uniref:3-hydroxyisobutyrate dehydrogenase, NAD-binding domain,NAD(P)-binding domain,6-phosphogluconate n=1 Tax=Cinara cedri TaxID=506608 RepID=A0A5E4MD49_9HEMI|nr:3-hydroxyisobutyrate dehydrogenase, NAD-binding domain,NAD(P)-binding domain,6-phosphogluconate [Cinara cedri]
MTGIDPKTSHDINEAVTKKQGRYMEAMIQGSITEAESGNLLILAAGNKELFDDCQSVFCAIAKRSCYLGDIGSAIKMNLILNTMKAVSVGGLAEAMALGTRSGLLKESMMDMLKITSLNCPLLLEKGTAIVDNKFQKDHTLKHLQKDLNLSINWSDMLQTPCPVSASVNEVFKDAKRLGYGDYDISSIYLRSRDF